MEVNLHLHEKQTLALNSRATEILYGGAAGGGKSHLMRAASIIWASEIPGLQTYLFRRVKDDLIKNHIEGPHGYRALLYPWVDSGHVVITGDEIRFWNGSKIYLCHCKDEKDRYKYQGAEMHVLLIDELTHFSDVIYRFLRNRVRMTGIKVPPRFQGLFPRIVAGSNPGNIGHIFVKHAFIDRCPEYEIIKMPAAEGGMMRQYIPAKLEDNPSMSEDDPDYEDRLSGLGTEQLVRAMRDGDWSVIEGAYFDGFNQKDHVLKPFPIPKHLETFLSFDWGYSKPFSVGLWAVMDGTVEHPTRNFNFPRGSLIRINEWYGVKTDKDGEFQPDVGLKLKNKQIGAGIVERFGKNHTMICDPSIFNANGGTPVAEDIWAGADKAIALTRGDNERIAGWQQVAWRLEGDAEGRPMLYFFNNCTHSIRTLPAMQHDEKRPEDINTKMEDHIADEIRYACMSRPIIRDLPPEKKPINSIHDMTLDEVVELTQTKRAAARI